MTASKGVSLAAQWGCFLAMPYYLVALVPRYAVMMAEQNLELPFATRLVFSLSEMASRFGFLIFPFLAMALVGLNFVVEIYAPRYSLRIHWAVATFLFVLLCLLHLFTRLPFSGMN